MAAATPPWLRVGATSTILVLLLILPVLPVPAARGTQIPTKPPVPTRGDTRAVDLILVSLDRFRLYTFKRSQLISRYAISVGADTSPTPTGRFHITGKLKNPWYTPDDRPARPPGPDNPLGTRWMGIDKPTFGLHGTRDPGSIGSRSSRGCIRLRNEDAEKLYDRIQRGTPVVIRRFTNDVPPPEATTETNPFPSPTLQGSYPSLPPS